MSVKINMLVRQFFNSIYPPKIWGLYCRWAQCLFAE